MHFLIKGKQTVKWSESMKQNIFRRFSTVGLCVAILLTVLIPSAALAETTAGEAALQITSQTPEAQDVGTQNETPQGLTFPVHVIHKTGDDKENFVIVIMADGYTKEQQDQFVQDATRKAQYLLNWSSYKEYSDRINIYAVGTVSNQSGISEYDGITVDTYFHVRTFGKKVQFSGDGGEKATKLRKELEDEYLDAGASIGTIHILSNYSNDEVSYGASVNRMYSFSTVSDDDTTVHELSHSIGDLGDEYDRYTTKDNLSDTTNPATIKWKKLLGFRGIGITRAGTETAFAPGRQCMMRRSGDPFCEVCKLELARHLSDTDYVKNPRPLYVADPEISIPHSLTGTLDQDSKKFRITESNITQANGRALEFRTVVQNTVNREQKLKLTFRILSADGQTVKYQKEQEFIVLPLNSWYRPDDARASLSLVFESVQGLVVGDQLEGRVIETETQRVLATDKTAEQAWSTVNVHYVLKDQEGAGTAVPQTTTAVAHVPTGSDYTLRYPQVYGYTCVGSSESTDTVQITGNSKDITYYYQVNNNPTERPIAALEIDAKKDGSAVLQAKVTGTNQTPVGTLAFYVDSYPAEMQRIDGTSASAQVSFSNLAAGLHSAYVKFIPDDRSVNVPPVTGQGKKFIVPEQDTVDCVTRPVYADYDGTPHTFDITCGKDVTIVYRTEANGEYNLTAMPQYTDAGAYTLYFKAMDADAAYEGEAFLNIAKAETDLQLNPSSTKLEGASAVTLQVFKTKMPENGAVTLDCNDSAIKPMPQGNDTWKVDLPNKTQTYTFTARYSGDNNYLASEDTCQIAVTAKGMQPGGNASGGNSGSGSSGGSSGGGISAGGGGAAPAPTLAGSDVVTVKDDKGNAISGSNVVTTTKATVSNTKNETSRNEQGQTVSKITGTVSKETAEKLVAQAVSNRSDIIEITVSSAAASSEAAATAKSTELEIPKTTVAFIAKDTDASMVVKTDSGTVTLDNKTLETITSETNGDTVKLIVKENAALTEAQRAASAAIGENGKLFDLAAQIGNRLLHDFQGGKAYVTLPMPDRLKGKNVLVIYIDDNGLCKILNHSVEKIGADDYVRFMTTHFSTFAVVEKDEAEQLIKEQNAAHVKELIQHAKFRVSTTKTSKRNVKVQVTVKTSKTLISDIKSLGYTVKYQFYRSTKKTAGYKLRKTSSKNSFISTKGTKGRKYYYKARVLVYDGSELVARSALKQCSYGARTWTK